MGKLAEAAILMRADNTRLQRGLGRGLGMIRGFAGKATAFINPVTAALAGLGAGVGIGGIAIASIKAAAGLEKTTVAFETMLGSAEKADKIIKDLRGFSDATPFEPDEVIKAGRGLLAFGTSSEQVVPTLRTLGDVAAGLQIPLGELTEIYGKARAQGRLFQEDINQLAGRGIPIYGELAKVLGVAESEVRNMVSAGKVGFPELQQVFQGLTAEGGQFAGLMARQSETTAGLFSTLKGRVTTVLEELGGAFIQGFGINEGLGYLIDNAQGAGKTIVSVVKSVTGFAGLAFTTIKAFITENAELFAAYGRAVGAQLKAIWEIASAVANGIGKTFSWIGTQLGLNSASWRDWKDGLLTIYAGVETAFSNWQKMLEIGFLSGWKFAVDFWDNLKDLFTNDIPAVLSFLANNWQGIFIDIGNGMVTILSNAADKISNLMSALWTTISTLGAEGLGDLKKAFSDALDPSDLLEGFKSAIPDEEVHKLLDELGKIEQSDLSKSLGKKVDGLKQELVDDFEKRLARNLGDTSKSIDQTEERSETQPGRAFEIEDRQPQQGENKPELPPLAQAAASGRNGFIGLQDLHRRTQEAALNRDPQKMIADNTKKAADEAQQNRKANEKAAKAVERAADGIEDLINLGPGVARFA